VRRRLFWRCSVVFVVVYRVNVLSWSSIFVSCLELRDYGLEVDTGGVISTVNGALIVVAGPGEAVADVCCPAG